jgi:hypothetical protein
MYVRWKRRTLCKRVLVKYQRKIVDGRYVVVNGRYETAPIWEKRPTGDYALSAQLVESHRVEGKPRQKVIKYLGTINQSDIAHIGHRIGFWRTVSAAFKALGLPPEQQHTIELALHARVPFPTQEDVQKARDEMAALMASIKSNV